MDIGPTYVEKGTNVTLPKCHVTGYPSPKLHWTKGGANLPANSFVKDGQLVIVNTGEKDMGQYRCEASNILGSSLAPTLLIVVNRPRFALRPPEVLNISVGRTISANCTAVGDGSPVLTWSRENGQLPVERSRVLANNTLMIQNVKVADSGRYVCTAATRGVLKPPQAFMQLNVLGELITCSFYYYYYYFHYFSCFFDKISLQKCNQKKFQDGFRHESTHNIPNSEITVEHFTVLDIFVVQQLDPNSIMYDISVSLV